MSILRPALLVFTLLAGSAAGQFKISIPNAATPEGGDLVITADKETRTLSCNKNSVFLRGNGGDIHIEGECKNVNILGNGNVVHVLNAERIVTEGNGNTVSYRNPNSGVSTPGGGNKVSVERTDK